MASSNNSYGTRSELNFRNGKLSFHSLKKLREKKGDAVSRLPYSLKILLENLLRYEDGVVVQKDDIDALVAWNAKAEPNREIQFVPSRILLQDFTGVPAVADLAAMRGAVKELGGDPTKINPLQPADLVIDHSVQVDYFGTRDAFQKNSELEFKRNTERYEFLKWGQSALKNFRVVPPATGIVHQVNLEYLASVAFTGQKADGHWVYPDSLVGTDSHTTMINGLGVLGWGVGGIEAEAAMLGQPISMLIPQVIGFRLKGSLAAGTTATDLVLTVTQILRKKGVVGKFVEFFGSGLSSLSLADRATIANMAPEYGATVGLFPVDEKTIEYLRLTGRDEEAERTEAYFKENELWFSSENPEPNYTDILELDLSTVEPSLAGPSRPQDRVLLKEAAPEFAKSLPSLLKAGAKVDTKVNVSDPTHAESYSLENGSVVLAAITSCTNTSNPGVLIAAGLLAKKALALGLKAKPWVKTSLAPGSKVVTDYLKKAGLMESLEGLGFHLVGYGCTTCIGNSGPLPAQIESAITEGNLVAASVLSGNRNFEGRISPHVRANYLASPPLVVAYAIAGTMNLNLTKDPIGQDKSGKPVFLKDIWPSSDELTRTVADNVKSELYKKSYSDVFTGDENWKKIKAPTGDLYKWDSKSTYIKEPPFFEGMSKQAPPVVDIKGARVLALLKDSVTTDHISPAGSIQKTSPAGKYLIENGVEPQEFNSFGSRRGNHEVMMRGTFGNVRIKNQLVPGIEGGFTRLFGKKENDQAISIYDASMEYQAEKTPLIVIAGKEYGTGSSRDWAAKGTLLLGVRAVIAESFERIHRSNLIGMGVLPLQFRAGEGAGLLGLKGDEAFEINELNKIKPGCEVKVLATTPEGKKIEFTTQTRIDTPNELEYFRNGGILHYVLRQLLKS